MPPASNSPKFDLKRIKDQDAVFVESRGDDGRPQFTLNPIIATVIEYAGVLGVPRVTASSFPTFMTRMRVWDSINGPLYLQDSGQTRSLAFEDVAIALGLSVAIESKNSRDFMSSVLGSYERSAERWMDEFLSTEESEPAHQD